jgi:alkylation response protein AidB-like acyl-CoA dehydrogenase
MIDIYGLDEPAGAWRQKAAALAADVAAHHALDVDTNARFPSESIAALAQEGFYGLCIDRRFGGQGQGPATFAAVVEELARHCGSTAMVYVMHIAAAKVIETSAPAPRRADVLRTIAEGKHLTTFALSEQGSRSQFWAPFSQLVEQEMATGRTP